MKKRLTALFLVLTLGLLGAGCDGGGGDEDIADTGGGVTDTGVTGDTGAGGITGDTGAAGG